MKKLLKLPLLLITLLLIFSCGRNAEADVESFKNMLYRYELLEDKEESKETFEEMLEILLEAEEIFSYYVNDANSDETLSFIRLLNESEVWRMDDREGLKEGLDETKEHIEKIKNEIIKLDIPRADY